MFSPQLLLAAETVNKRTTKKSYPRSLVRDTLEVMQQKRSENPEDRESVLHEVNKSNKKTIDKKRAHKAKVMAKAQKTTGKDASKGAAPEGPEFGGGKH